MAKKRILILASLFLFSFVSMAYGVSEMFQRLHISARHS